MLKLESLAKRCEEVAGSFLDDDLAVIIGLCVIEPWKTSGWSTRAPITTKYERELMVTSSGSESPNMTLVGGYRQS